MFRSVYSPIFKPVFRSVYGTGTPDDPGPDPDEGLLPLGDATVKNVWVDNDDTRDAYLTETGMAAHANNLIRLRGISTSSSTNADAYNPFVTPANVTTWGNDRIAERNAALSSGFKDTIPVPQTPISGHLANTTTALNTTAAQALVAAINTYCSPDDPMIVCCGGPLTIVADAYLIDPTIVDKMTVMFISGSTDTDGYNEWADHFAAQVAYTHLTLVRYPLTEATLATKAPSVPKARILSDMPNSYLQGIVYAKDHPGNSLPGEYDPDGGLIAAILDPNFPQQVTRQEMTGTVNQDIGGTVHAVPATGANPSGNIWHIDEIDQTAGTNAWWSCWTLTAWTGGYLHSYFGTFTDDFNRPDSADINPVDETNWVTVGGSSNGIISGRAGRSTGAGNNLLNESPIDGQYVSVKFPAPTVNNYPGVLLRGSYTGGINGYLLVTNSNVDNIIQRYDAGTPTTILNNLPAPAEAKQWFFEAIGDVISVWIYSENSEHPLYYENLQLVGVICDYTYPTGVPGLVVYATTPTTLDDWTSGSVALLL